ncbi:cysteine-rich protective antigen, putative [Plasmodium reichenowi]|uniref:Cysteine-rich protective antigen, putative n=3 Tax=Plasmodium reichenowi TaxID=5854 RepID=A0A060RTR8_PLARE|nr:cysteine-rich protective antigen, putative [Plasmodium reichenowi]
MIIPFNKKIISFFQIVLVVLLLCRSIYCDSRHVFIRTELSFVKNSVPCVGDMFFIYKRELYNICSDFLRSEGDDPHIYVQKKVKDSWIILFDLFKETDLTRRPHIFTYIDVEEIIILLCENEEFGNRKKDLTCHRFYSNDGKEYNNSEITISDHILKDKILSSYASFPLRMKDQEYFLICGISPYKLKDETKKDNILCMASHDKGETWRTKVVINYDEYKLGVQYFSLRPYISKNNLSFHFYVGDNINNVKNINFIECINEKDFEFTCSNKDFLKVDKVLQDVSKLNDQYIVSYGNDNNFNECYIFFNNENSILIKPEKRGSKNGGCYGGKFVKIDEHRILFIYSSSQGIYNIHIIYYSNYE